MGFIGGVSLDKALCHLLFIQLPSLELFQSVYDEQFGLMSSILSVQAPISLFSGIKGQQFILEANENYYGEQPQIQRAVVLIQEEDAPFCCG